MESPDPNLKWHPTNAPVASSRTDDIWFIDPSVGWAVNSNGQIIKTSDGGESWVQQFQDSVYFRCIGFANPNKGWAGTLTPDRTMFKTEDGGTNWTPVTNLPTSAPSAICGLSVVNESVVYASGTNYPNRPARMMKSVDGGANWTGWEMGDHATLLVDTFFTSPGCGWVVGGKAAEGIANPTRVDVKPVVLFTENGGSTWENRTAAIQGELPLGEWGWKIQFLNDQVGFVSLENFDAGAILKTTDGGNSWVRLPVNDPQGNANLEGIGFVTPKHGWVGGWGDVSFQGGYSSETSDGGSNWVDANEIGRFINRFRFFGDPVTVGYASGKTVYKYSSDPMPEAALAAEESPLRFLRSNEPAETSGALDIEYEVPEGSKYITIDIWDRFGEHVGKLLNEKNPSPGSKSVVCDFKDEGGIHLPSGIFIFRITIDGDAESRIIWKCK